MLFYQCTPPPTNYILTLVKPFSFVWYIIPLLKTGAFDSTQDLFLQISDEKTQKKTKVGFADCNYQWQYSPNGGIQWLLTKPWTLSIGRWARDCTGAPPQPSKWPSKLVHFLLSCRLLLPWRPLGWYRVSSCPMAASSGFLGSPRHAASGNAVCFSLAHRHGHWNGQQQRNIMMPLLILS